MQQYWKVLIADDEPIIREGIRDAVNWQALQMEVVAEAEDGEEALELAVEHAVDVLLVDLNMPIMNGLKLIKHVREQLPQAKIIIITGHDEFSYAQEAIRLQVNDYILKPANPVQLHNVLENICKELKETIQQEEYLTMASNQITKNFPLLRERFCLEWIEGNMAEAEIVKQLEFLQLPMEAPRQFGLIQCPEFYANKPLLKENDKQLFTFSTENIVSEVLEPLQKVIFRDHSGLMGVCVWGNVTEDMVSSISTSLKTYLKITTNVHFERVEGGVTEIAEVYRRCKAAISEDLQISPIVRRARQYIIEHFSETDITLESLAQFLQVSPVYLSRIIKKELGTSFVGLITNMRINMAIRLLNSTDLSILEIAERVGYDTQHYFSTAFKKIMGLSPNQYRKSSLALSNMSGTEEN